VHPDQLLVGVAEHPTDARIRVEIGTFGVGDEDAARPTVSDMLGGLAAHEISTLYYPATSRPGLRAFHSFLLGFSGRACSHLMQEFIYRKLTTHVPKLARSQPVLRDGTPVSLFSVEDLRSATAQSARPVTFVLVKACFPLLNQPFWNGIKLSGFRRPQGSDKESLSLLTKPSPEG
jgi:hypothetical protein